MGTPLDLEEMLVELDSPQGEPLLRRAGTERFNGGGGRSGLGQAERFGVEHG